MDFPTDPLLYFLVLSRKKFDPYSPVLVDKRFAPLLQYLTLYKTKVRTFHFRDELILMDDFPTQAFRNNLLLSAVLNKTSIFKHACQQFYFFL